MKALNLLCMLSSYRKCTIKMDRSIPQIGAHGLHAVYTLPITQYNLTTVWNCLLPIQFIKLLFNFYMIKRHAFACMFTVDWPLFPTVEYMDSSGAHGFLATNQCFHPGSYSDD